MSYWCCCCCKKKIGNWIFCISKKLKNSSSVKNACALNRVVRFFQLHAHFVRFVCVFVCARARAATYSFSIFVNLISCTSTARRIQYTSLNWYYFAFSCTQSFQWTTGNTEKIIKKHGHWSRTAHPTENKTLRRVEWNRKMKLKSERKHSMCDRQHTLNRREEKRRDNAKKKHNNQTIRHSGYDIQKITLLWINS